MENNQLINNIEGIVKTALTAFEKVVPSYTQHMILENVAGNHAAAFVRRVSAETGLRSITQVVANMPNCQFTVAEIHHLIDSDGVVQFIVSTQYVPNDNCIVFYIAYFNANLSMYPS